MSSIQRLDVHGHLDRMLAATGDDASHRTDVAKITTERNRDVFLTGLDVVGGVKINPAGAGAKNGKPRVARIHANQTRLAFRRAGAQIAADVTRRQTERTQERNAEMRKILADAASFFQNLLQRRGDGRGFNIVFEISENTAGEVFRAFDE